MSQAITQAKAIGKGLIESMTETFESLCDTLSTMATIGHLLHPDSDLQPLIRQARRLNAIMAILNRRQMNGQDRWPVVPDDLIA